MAGLRPRWDSASVFRLFATGAGSKPACSRTPFMRPDEPYEKLKRALRAEIDEAAWSSLYSTKSRPFDKPETGKIAVKVINHYGDEVLKVFGV